MKYMITLSGSQQHYDAMGGGSEALPNWSPAEIQAMLDHMHALNADLQASGEWVEGQGLAAPNESRRVQIVGGELKVTDAPYAVDEHTVAGYWVVEVDGLDRATRIAERAARCPVPAGYDPGTPVDIRRIGEAPDPDQA